MTPVGSATVLPAPRAGLVMSSACQTHLARASPRPHSTPSLSGRVRLYGAGLTQGGGVLPFARGGARSHGQRGLDCRAAKPAKPEIKLEIIDPDFPLPTTPTECVALALGGMQRAHASGIRRFATEWLLPVDQRQYNFMAVEAADYPCSIATEFAAAKAMVGSLLTEWDKAAGAGAGEISTSMLDDGGGISDLIGLSTTPTKSASAIIFPTGDSLPQVRKLAEICDKEGGRPLVMSNRQWSTRGQIISEFGIGPWRKKAEDFIDSFEKVFVLTEQRIGDATGAASITGGVVRILKVYPSKYHSFVMTREGGAECIMVTEAEPDYFELEEVLRQWKLANERDALPLMFGGNGSSATPSVEIMENIDPENIVKFRRDEIEIMDKSTVQRLLNLYGVPTSGKLSILRENEVE
mmetsp:Transcript_22831/g.70956  ORF Transcript_22831/g.70956 Transcript_22831/m.70956 type:complete len:409 (+) Transcript_22831:457-1683(+)